MQRYRLSHEQLQVRHPLAWNVYNEHGQLLLRCGHVLQDAAQVRALIERGVYVDLDDYARTHAQTAEAARAQLRQNPQALWADVQQRMERLLTRPLEPGGFQADVSKVAHDLRHSVDAHRDASLFEALQGDNPATYAVDHAMQTAFVANLVSEHMGWSDNERHCLTQAALTMNLGMGSLQAQLALQLSPLNGQQRQTVASHALDSREQLEAAGVSDADWLRAVEAHHVTPGGGPLPAHHEKLGEHACMLHYTDVYLAKISARASRPALPSHVAARSLFLQADGQHNPYVAAIIKALGLYPPGSCVKLANGELGIVVKRGEAAHLPEVHSLINSQGQPLPESVPRNTALAPFKVVDALPRGKLAHRLQRAPSAAHA